MDATTWTFIILFYLYIGLSLLGSFAMIDTLYYDYTHNSEHKHTVSSVCGCWSLFDLFLYKQNTLEYKTNILKYTEVT